MSEPQAPAARQWSVLIGTFVGVLVLDQASKHWALNRLSEGPIELVGSLQLRLAFNPGAAFSMGGGGGFGVVVAVLAFVVIGILLAGSSPRTRLGAVAVGLVAGGAVGNLVDRAFRGDEGFMGGKVVDMVDLGWWPVFNVADAAICVGAVALVAISFRQPVEPG